MNTSTSGFDYWKSLMNLDERLSDIQTHYAGEARAKRESLNPALTQTEKAKIEADRSEHSDRKKERSATLLRDGASYVNLLYDHLGVVGGATGLAHSSKKAFILLQHNLLPQPDSSDDFVSVDVPYFRGNSLSGCDETSQSGLPNEYAFINFMFAGRRRKQSFSAPGSGQTAGRDSGGPPEFYNHLPPNGDEFWLLPCERQLRKNAGFQFLYCSAGEVSFFVYAWRWLMRTAQRGTLQLPMDSSVLPENTCVESGGDGPLPFWEGREFWGTDLARTKHSFELDWIERMEDAKRDGAKGDSGSAMAFNRQAVAEWESIRKRLDEGDIGNVFDFAQDWPLLGLTANSCPTRALLGLLRFACHMSHALSQRDSWTNTSKDQLLKAKDVLNTWEERIRHQVANSEVEPNPLSFDDTNAIHRWICRVAFEFLSRSLKPAPQLGSLLRELHRQARFPILPYFYLTALEGGAKEHLILPVWLSNEFELSIQREEEKEALKTPHVVLALLTLDAPWDLPRRISLTCDHKPEHEPSEMSDETIERLYQLSTVCGRLVRPIIDSVFYGDLVAAEMVLTATHRAEVEVERRRAEAERGKRGAALAEVGHTSFNYVIEALDAAYNAAIEPDGRLYLEAASKIKTFLKNKAIYLSSAATQSMAQITQASEQIAAPSENVLTYQTAHAIASTLELANYPLFPDRVEPTAQDVQIANGAGENQRKWNATQSLWNSLVSIELSTANLHIRGDGGVIKGGLCTMLENMINNSLRHSTRDKSEHGESGRHPDFKISLRVVALPKYVCGLDDDPINQAILNALKHRNLSAAQDNTHILEFTQLGGLTFDKKALARVPDWIEFNLTAEEWRKRKGMGLAFTYEAAALMGFERLETGLFVNDNSRYNHKYVFVIPTRLVDFSSNRRLYRRPGRRI